MELERIVRSQKGGCMKKNILVVAFAAAGILVLAGLSACFSSGSGGDDADDDGGEVTHQYLVIPGAQFFAGAPTAATTGAAKPTVTAPANKTYTVGNTVTWTVEWTAELELEFGGVTDIVINVPEIAGYFDYMLSDTEITNRQVEIDTYVVWDRPDKTQVCNRDYRGNGTCYEQADTGVTEMNFTAANAGPYDGSVELVDLEITFEAEFTVEEVVISEVTDEGGGGGEVGDTVCSSWVSMPSCNFRACSNGERSWYDVGSGVYYCASLSDCTGAAAQAAAYCSR